MNFQEYEEKAITTRVYAPEVAKPYVVLGLCGELGEMFEKISEGSTRELILKEIGDVLWYTAAIRVELDLAPLKWPTPSEEDPTGFFTLIKNQGIVAEQMKKYLRDDWKPEDSKMESNFSEERKEKIHGALQSLLEELQTLVTINFGKDLQDIAAENIEKLAKRKENNLIHGDGDCRGEK